MADKDNNSKLDDAKDHVEERITLARGEVWLLRIAAATGVIGMLSHGLDFLHEIGVI